MTPMTSCAASLTERARKRAEPPCNAHRRSTSTPPPPGRCTSSRTTSGRLCVTAATASSTSAASPTTSTASPISVRTLLRNIAWSSTTSTRTRPLPCSLIVGPYGAASAARDVVRSCVLLLGRRGARLRTRHRQRHLGTLTRRRADPGRPAVPLHPPHHRPGQTHPVGRHRVRVEALPAVADEHLHAVAHALGEDVHDRGARVSGGV